MTIETLPDWLAALDEEDLGFIRKFVLSSGSLKEMASPKVYWSTSLCRIRAFWGSKGKKACSLLVFCRK